MSWAWKITGTVKAGKGPAETQTFVVVTHGEKAAEALERGLSGMTSMVYETGSVTINLDEPELVGEVRG